ncbi:MAG: hypothetical protein ACLPN5_05835, partial [Roseiarcus sp.]
ANWNPRPVYLVFTTTVFGDLVERHMKKFNYLHSLSSSKNGLSTGESAKSGYRASGYRAKKGEERPAIAGSSSGIV